MAVSPKSLANLKPPKKGEIRNPNGKKPGEISFKAVARELLELEGFMVMMGEVMDENDKLTGEMVKVRIKIPTKKSLMLQYMGHAKKTTNVVETFKEWFDGKETQKIDLTAEKVIIDFKS